MSSRPSGSLHWQRDEDSTACGRPITATVRLTGDPGKVTCRSCWGSHVLDGALGAMTHTGHW